MSNANKWKVEHKGDVVFEGCEKEAWEKCSELYWGKEAQDQIFIIDPKSKRSQFYGPCID